MHRFQAVYEEAYQAIMQDGYEPPFIEFSLIAETPYFCDYMYDRPKGSGKYYALFSEFVRRAELKTIVELGNREGAGILAFYSGMKANPAADIHLYTIDLISDLRLLSEDIRRAENIHYIYGDVLEASVYKRFRGKAIDILFCDTIHTAKQLYKEWKIYEPYLADEAVIFVDDVMLADKGDAFERIRHEKLIDTDLHTSGFGVIFYNRRRSARMCARVANFFLRRK